MNTEEQDDYQDYLEWSESFEHERDDLDSEVFWLMFWWFPAVTWLSIMHYLGFIN